MYECVSVALKTSHAICNLDGYYDLAEIFFLFFFLFFLFQAEDGIRDLVRSRGLGDVYKRQYLYGELANDSSLWQSDSAYIAFMIENQGEPVSYLYNACLLYTSDAADERSSVDLGGRRIIKKKKREQTECNADDEIK